ncbi:unnamed protein product [Caenorhabditis auriculariae]|uniref:Uncharacterized protein n=1 Tax=Caenorhabditis auriculariae TaxID=2777116 RepID=A0A8S1HNC4_9PELO|nr:unnamed protein product [Caenorhabditis auriculariae]
MRTIRPPSGPRLIQMAPAQSRLVHLRCEVLRLLSRLLIIVLAPALRKLFGKSVMHLVLVLVVLCYAGHWYSRKFSLNNLAFRKFLLLNVLRWLIGCILTDWEVRFQTERGGVARPCEAGEAARHQPQSAAVAAAVASSVRRSQWHCMNSRTSFPRIQWSHGGRRPSRSPPEASQNSFLMAEKSDMTSINEEDDVLLRHLHRRPAIMSFGDKKTFEVVRFPRPSIDVEPRLTQEHASAVSYRDPTAVEATAARSSGKAADWGSRGHSPPPYHCSSLPLLRQPSDRDRTPRSHALVLGGALKVHIWAPKFF